mmetsp:Transcript_39480/g.117441  ORF Transcript_39480/g.117441 Transcript_39480/m.117441 type:complete len:99 (-) Transcript_39480:465-761(-)
MAPSNETLAATRVIEKTNSTFKALSSYTDDQGSSRKPRMLGSLLASLKVASSSLKGLVSEGGRSGKGCSAAVNVESCASGSALTYRSSQETIRAQVCV